MTQKSNFIFLFVKAHTVEKYMGKREYFICSYLTGVEFILNKSI